MVRAAYDVVIPTIGRPSLAALLNSLLAAGADPQQILVVDDRRHPTGPLADLPVNVKPLRGRGAGPAAARNLGWRAGRAPWVVFLDDDVEVTADWAACLQDDLTGAAAVGGSQGRIMVPVPDGRLTDWQRNVQGLERARWATADMAYRRDVLQRVGGFDERFRRAYREDADLALRVMNAGYRLEMGERLVRHPVRPASPWISVRLQRGNSDDVLMTRLHGTQWRERAGAPQGQLRAHRLVTAGAAGALLKSKLAATLWVAGTARLAYRRIAAGPHSAKEIGTMLATSAAIPPVASFWWLHGLFCWRQLSNRPAAVLFDRDGTLVHDVPYNGDPAAVVPVPGARQALDRVRRAGLPIGVVSNQSGVGRGWLQREQVEAVNNRVEELLGRIDVWRMCPHTESDGCGCRKPAPGLILSAAAALGVQPQQCAVIGDIGADVVAGTAVGARTILVPTPVTRPTEVSAAPEVAGDLMEAVNRLLGSAP
jgi:HAD superfamily hydrolase (TIGR01662 family)